MREYTRRHSVGLEEDVTCWLPTQCRKRASKGFSLRNTSRRTVVAGLHEVEGRCTEHIFAPTVRAHHPTLREQHPESEIATVWVYYCASSNAQHRRTRARVDRVSNHTYRRVKRRRGVNNEGSSHTRFARPCLTLREQHPLLAQPKEVHEALEG